MHERAFFYLRDPDYVDSGALSRRRQTRPRARELWQETEGEARESLKALKQTIRETVPHTTDYSGPRDLADRVRADLIDLVEQSFPDESAIDPQAAEGRLHRFFADLQGKDLRPQVLIL